MASRREEPPLVCSTLEVTTAETSEGSKRSLQDLASNKSAINGHQITAPADGAGENALSHRMEVVKNGWHWPFEFLQVLSWVAWLLQLTTLYPIVLLVSQSVTGAAVLTALYSILAIVVGLVTGVATTIDPVDSKALHILPTKAPEGVDVQEYMFCNLCRLAVKRSSKHCRRCNKCVQDYDHHCVAINNCVGSKNYRWFFASVLGACLMSAIHVFMCMYLLGASLMEWEWLDRSLKYAFDCSKDGPCFLVSVFSPTFMFIFASILSVFNIPVLLSVLQLLSFHIMLWWRQINTYEYLDQQRKAASARLRKRRAAQRKALAEKMPKPATANVSSV